MNDDSAAIENDGTNNNNDLFDWNYYTFLSNPRYYKHKIISNDGTSTVQVEKLEEYSQNTKTI